MRIDIPESGDPLPPRRREQMEEQRHQEGIPSLDTQRKSDHKVENDEEDDRSSESERQFRDDL